MMNKALIGIDLGGTKILSGKIKNKIILDTYKSPVPTNGTKEEILHELFKAIDIFFDDDIIGIGVGVPSVVDIERGIVYDVQNIPSWKEVHLKTLLENKYQVSVYINNDANCFAVGEKHFGIAQNYKTFIGLIIGTGMAGGIIINNKLFNGANCGAGEFGTMSYLDHTYEYYSCGQFFKNVHNKDGLEVYQDALNGDPDALRLYEELGFHLGKAIKAILYSLDPGIIILGGSVSKAYDFFKKSMWQSLQKFEFHKTIEGLKIEISKDPQIALLGAAALYFDAQKSL